MHEFWGLSCLGSCTYLSSTASEHLASWFLSPPCCWNFLLSSDSHLQTLLTLQSPRTWCLLQTLFPGSRAPTPTYLALAFPSFPESTLKTTLKVLFSASSLQPSDEWDTRIQTPSEKAGYQAKEVRGIRSMLILPKSKWELRTDTKGPSTGLKELLCVTSPHPLIAPEQSFLHHKFCACGYNRWSEQGGQTPQGILKQRRAACISFLLSTEKKVKVLVTQLCLILCNPMNYNPPDSSVHGILQARLLEWVAIPFFRVSSQPRDWTQVSSIAGRFFTIWATGLSQGGLQMLFLQ